MVVSLDDKFALAHARLAEAYMELDYKEKAAAELLKVHTLIPDRSALPTLDQLYIEAITAMATADFAGAVGKYQEIAKLTPNEPSVYLDLGRAYGTSNDSKNAIAS